MYKANAVIIYHPWRLRGFNGPVWQVYVEITESRDISQLVAVKRRLNTPPVSGIILAENNSRALARLGDGWKELDNGLWYKVFP
jgi:hypothetical protein